VTEEGGSSTKGLEEPEEFFDFEKVNGLEGRILARQREIEDPFGEFPGQYSGCRNYPVIEIDRVSHCKDPLYEALYPQDHRACGARDRSAYRRAYP
jgi:3-octaprenyl-4-hydroxybenzoate carboxy-lyase